MEAGSGSDDSEEEDSIGHIKSQLDRIIKDIDGSQTLCQEVDELLE
jgi:hypothetical protein